MKSNTQKKKSAKPDDPEMDEKTRIPEEKKASPEDSDQPQSDDVNDEDDDDSLPDPFAPKEKKAKMMSGTKEDQVQKVHKQKWTQCRSSSQAMTMMPH